MSKKINFKPLFHQSFFIQIIEVMCNLEYFA